MMKVGAKVMRGADWKWGDQDGGALGVGRVIGELGEDGWVRVQWETGSTNSYRFGVGRDREDNRMVCDTVMGITGGYFDGSFMLFTNSLRR